MNAPWLLLLCILLGVAMPVLIVAIVILARRLRQLTISVECLCSNLDGLRAQIGHGHPS